MAFCLSGHQDLNLGPPAPKAGALPDCATPRKMCVSVKCVVVWVCTKIHFVIFWRWSRDSNPGYRFQYVSLANWWFKPLTHSTLEREKQAISFNNRVFPEATAKIYAAAINTNEIEKKFPHLAFFF